MKNSSRVKGLTGVPPVGRAGCICGLPVSVTPALRAITSDTAVTAFDRPLP
jgi:hypothetical protein